MGGNWFKAIVNIKKTKKERSNQSKGPSSGEKSKGFKWRYHSRKGLNKIFNGGSSHNPGVLGMPIEDIAAIRIQTTFRGYMVRKNFRCLKGLVRLQTLTQGQTVNKQANATMNYLQTWIKVQNQIRVRRIFMVTEGRIKQKKQENQLKLEAKLHELQVEWCGGSETMEEILARIQQREEASVKRERAMAYAFNHQWKANSSHILGQFPYDFSKGGNWGWSWKERWIAARPWESRVHIQSSSPNKIPNKLSSNSKKIPSAVVKMPNSAKPDLNGKGPTYAADTKKVKRLSGEKATNQDSKAKVGNSSPPTMQNITQENSV
ncbi:protein IQ-DOMAIN 10-like isoform X2 [Aristolochia californica]|uniref:protein IQ-DOMAIN 10-like isoform X2 n=1 Tax=Aristolochia californica TaxID=171875 RepID=UPI0035DF90AE